MRPFAIVLVASVFATALAACPNQCSGHGWCDENDRCICFRAPGTANIHTAFVGADCSQRICPFGQAHDVLRDQNQELVDMWSPANGRSTVGFLSTVATSKPMMAAFLNGGFLLGRDYGVDIRVVASDVNSNTVRFQWKLSNERVFRNELVASLGTGLYTTRVLALQIKSGMPPKDSGLYVYFDVAQSTDIESINAGDRYWVNVTYNDGGRFLAADGNTGHQNMECSGRGTCDRSTGQCQCSEGFTGDACQRTSCPSDCSGHGICQSQRYLVEDAVAGSDLAGTVTYAAAFDAETAYGCKCDSGFRGPACSQRECPSGPDSLHGDGGGEGMDCSGRGMCDYSTGICACFKGFYGERCEEQSTLV